MIGRRLAVGSFLICAAALALGADAQSSRPHLSAPEIVQRNIAARGGLEAWHSIQTLSFEGKMGAGGNAREALRPISSNPKARRTGPAAIPQRPAQEAELPFVMELKRPRKERLELKVNGKTAVQVYDGTNGWKLRPFLNRNDVEPFTEEELQVASQQFELDGPLVDYASKGTRVELVGIEKVDDRDNYKLKLTTKAGRTLHVWIDANTFLETKMEGQPRRLDGKYHSVEVYLRDYRAVGGVRIPYVLETRVLPIAGVKSPAVPTESIVIDKVAVNPKFDDSLFAKPR